MASYVYGIVDAYGSVRYVGKTHATPEKRFDSHVRTALRREDKTKHLPLYRWLLKHLDEAHVIEIESGAWTRTTLNDREIEWIAYFNLDCLLNISKGGNGGVTHAGAGKYERSAETRARQSAAMKALCAEIRAELDTSGILLYNVTNT